MSEIEQDETIIPPDKETIEIIRGVFSPKNIEI